MKNYKTLHSQQNGRRLHVNDISVGVYVPPNSRCSRLTIVSRSEPSRAVGRPAP